MIINNNRYNPQFGSLKVCDNAQPALMRLPIEVAKKVYRLGGYLSDTKHVDVEIRSDLTPFIKSKFNRIDGGIRPPFRFVEPIDDGNLKVVASYEGEVPIGTKNGNGVEFSINFKDRQIASNIFERFNRTKGDIEKASLLAKMIDAEIQIPFDIARRKLLNRLEKYQVVENILSEFGTWAK